MAAALRRYEDRNLAYSVGAGIRVTSDGGYWDFNCETSGKNIPAVKQAFVDLLTDKRLRSEDRFHTVQSALEYSRRMRTLSPLEFNRQAIMGMLENGNVISEDSWLSLINGISHEESNATFDQMASQPARHVVFRGLPA